MTEKKTSRSRRGRKAGKSDGYPCRTAPRVRRHRRLGRKRPAGGALRAPARSGCLLQKRRKTAPRGAFCGGPAAKGWFGFCESLAAKPPLRRRCETETDGGPRREAVFQSARENMFLTRFPGCFLQLRIPAILPSGSSAVWRLYVPVLL